ncbi:site-specific integrase [Kineococcus endophyticus]
MQGTGQPVMHIVSAEVGVGTACERVGVRVGADHPSAGSPASPSTMATVEGSSLRRASVEAIVERILEHNRREGKDPNNVRHRVRGAEHVLRYLSTHDGACWQERWDSSPLAMATLNRCPQLIVPGCSTPLRARLTRGVSVLLSLDVVRPGLHFVTGTRACELWKQLPLWRQDADAGLLQTRRQGTLQSRQHACALLGRVMLLTGKTIAQVSSEDLLHYRALTRDVAPAYGIEQLWNALAALPTSPVTGTFRASQRPGQRSIEELVDLYPVRNRRVRKLFIVYFTRRAPDLDYSSLRTLVFTLVSWFWCAVEEVEPGIDTLALAPATVEAWVQKATFRTLPGGERVERRNLPHGYMTVRSFYQDLQRWAHEEPERWAVWACRSPITDQHLAGYRKWRRRLTSEMHQRTRHRAPVVTRLADAAESFAAEASALLEAAAAADSGAEFVHDGAHFRRVGAGKAGQRIRVLQLDAPTAQVRDLTTEEEDAFWAFCLIETLRHTGARIEEVLELTQMDLTPYERDGQTVVLLHINPSKTDQERIVVVPPELAAVFAQMTTRVRHAAGGTGQALPLVTAYDYGEARELAALPMLFQRTAGRGVMGVTRPMNSKYVRQVITATCDRARITGPDGQVLRFTPHDFRRSFATDALASGLPPHIIAKLMGHESLLTTQQYMAIFPEDVIRAHRSFVAKRRSLPERREEYRSTTEAEWKEFEEHFGKRQIAIGNCLRAYRSSCSHEYACEQCKLARPDEAARPRLQRVLTGLAEQLTEARSHEWAGEVERLLYIQAAVHDKLAELDRARRRNQSVTLPMPSVRT